MTDVTVSTPSWLFNVVNFRKKNIRIVLSSRQSDTRTPFGLHWKRMKERWTA